MKEVLFNLLKNSRSDYFNYPVSAALVFNDGSVSYGVNVETSSPAAGICAERNALYSAITKGLNTKEIREIHVMSKTIGAPCFICRQALVDYCNMDVKVFMYDLDGNTKEYTLNELCTYPFSKENL